LISALKIDRVQLAQGGADVVGDLVGGLFVVHTY
jgi:hypothetical protein